jgi:hypothetical protein
MSHIGNGFSELPVDLFSYVLLSFVSSVRDILSMRLTCKSWAAHLQLPNIDATKAFEKPLSSHYRIKESKTGRIDLKAIIRNKIAPISKFVAQLHFSKVTISKPVINAFAQYLSSSTAHLKILSLDKVELVERLYSSLPLATGLESLQIVLRNDYDDDVEQLPDLSKLSNLRSLDFRQKLPEDHQKLCRVLSTMLLTCPNLTSLRLCIKDDYQNEHADYVLNGIAHLTNLEHLELLPAFDRHLLIPKLPRLRSLDIRDFKNLKVEDEIKLCQAVQAHPSLQELHVTLGLYIDAPESKTALALFEMIKMNTVLTTIDVRAPYGLCPPSMDLMASLHANQSLTSFGFQVNEAMMPSLTALLSSPQCRLFDVCLFNAKSEPASVTSLEKLIDSIKVPRRIRLGEASWDPMLGPERRKSEQTKLSKAAMRSGCVLLTFEN